MIWGSFASLTSWAGLIEGFPMGRHIVIMGFKGCGKTTVGEALARRLGLDFLDLDSHLEGKYCDSTGERLTFREIYRRIGEEEFRRLELEALEDALDADHKVIALGGGTLTMQAARELLSGQDLFYIYVEPDELFKSIMRWGIPSFFDPDDPKGSFRRLYRERSPIYERMASRVIDATGKEHDEVVEELAAVIEAMGEGS